MSTNFAQCRSGICVGSEIPFVPFAADRLFLRPPILITSYIFKCTILLLNDAAPAFEFQRASSFCWNLIYFQRLVVGTSSAMRAREQRWKNRWRSKRADLHFNPACWQRCSLYAWSQNDPFACSGITERKMRGVRERERWKIPFEGARFIENSIAAAQNSLSPLKRTWNFTFLKWQWTAIKSPRKKSGMKNCPPWNNPNICWS